MQVGRMMPVLRGLMVCGVATLLLTAGCGKKKRPPPPPAPKADTATEPVDMGEDLADDSSIADTYIYTPVGKRDPFRSEYKEVAGPTQEGGGPRTPLQMFEIDQLQLIAVISGISQPRAMVVAPDGKGYTVKIGTRIGKNYGRVVRIKTDEVIIAEDYRDWNGRKVTNYIHVGLKKDKKK